MTGKVELAQPPAGDIKSLRRDHQQVAAQVLPANREVVLVGVGGNAVEFAAKIDLGSAQMVELNVLRSPGNEKFTRIALYRQCGYLDWDRSAGWARQQRAPARVRRHLLVGTARRRVACAGDGARLSGARRDAETACVHRQECR